MGDWKNMWRDLKSARRLEQDQQRKRRWIGLVEILLYIAIFGGGLAILGVVLWLT